MKLAIAAIFGMVTFVLSMLSSNPIQAISLFWAFVLATHMIALMASISARHRLQRLSKRDNHPDQ